MKNVVDSSGWLEYFTGGANTAVFSPPIQATDRLIVPAICIYEVFKRVLAQAGEEEALRAAGITPIANTNRSAANAAGSEQTLAAAGLGAFKHGETLFLMGDDATGSSKDQRRATIAARWCVIAMAGDQLGDVRPDLCPRHGRHRAV